MRCSRAEAKRERCEKRVKAEPNSNRQSFVSNVFPVFHTMHKPFSAGLLQCRLLSLELGTGGSLPLESCEQNLADSCVSGGVGIILSKRHASKTRPQSKPSMVEVHIRSRGHETADGVDGLEERLGSWWPAKNHGFRVASVAREYGGIR